MSKRPKALGFFVPPGAAFLPQFAAYQATSSSVAGVAAGRPRRRRPGARRVLPLRFGGQPVRLARLRRQPAAVLRRRVPRHAERRLLSLAEAPGLVGVGRRRLARPRRRRPASRPAAGAVASRTRTGRTRPRSLRPCPSRRRRPSPSPAALRLGIAARFVRGAPHREVAAGDGDHVEADLGVGNRLGVGRERRGRRLRLGRTGEAGEDTGAIRPDAASETTAISSGRGLVNWTGPLERTPHLHQRKRRHERKKAARDPVWIASPP